MYIYELPFDINKELCRLLDIEDYWKELAGNWMKYSAFDVNDMEQTARRNSSSPTNHLLTRWGQLNHRVEELFILLYKMKHIPALNCLKPVVNSDFHKLLSKSRNSCSTKERKTSHENSNKKSSLKTDGNFGSIPVPVMLIEKNFNRYMYEQSVTIIVFTYCGVLYVEANNVSVIVQDLRAREMIMKIKR